MCRPQLRPLLVLVGLIAAPALALAGPNANARVALHVTSATTVDRCTRAEARPACDDLVTSGGLYPPNLHFVYLLFVNGDATAGIGGGAVGIDYDSGMSDGVGVDVFGWTLCAARELGRGNWPAPGGSELISWDVPTQCQTNEPGGPGTGVTATIGYFYVGAYGDDEMRIINEVRPNRVQVASCASVIDDIEDSNAPNVPSRLGRARFSPGGTAPGYNPCDTVIPVTSVPWSRVKALASSRNRR